MRAIWLLLSLCAVAAACNHKEPAVPRNPLDPALAACQISYRADAIISDRHYHTAYGPDGRPVSNYMVSRVQNSNDSILLYYTYLYLGDSVWITAYYTPGGQPAPSYSRAARVVNGQVLQSMQREPLGYYTNGDGSATLTSFWYHADGTPSEILIQHFYIRKNGYAAEGYSERTVFTSSQGRVVKSIYRYYDGGTCYSRSTQTYTYGATPSLAYNPFPFHDAIPGFRQYYGDRLPIAIDYEDSSNQPTRTTHLELTGIQDAQGLVTYVDWTWPHYKLSQNKDTTLTARSLYGYWCR